MKIRVIKGTPTHEGTLCDTCSYAMIRRGTQLKHEYYGCSSFEHQRIPQPVTDCTSYHDKRLNLPAEFERQAFRWVPSLGTFLAPQEWRDARDKKKLQQRDFEQFSQYSSPG